MIELFGARARWTEAWRMSRILGPEYEAIGGPVEADKVSRLAFAAWLAREATTEGHAAERLAVARGES